MVSYDLVTIALLFSKKRFTSSDPHHSSMWREDEQSGKSELAGSQQQEIDRLNIPSFTPIKGSKGFENIGPKVSRIHVLGEGPVGKLVAHAIAGIPDPPPITLLFNSVRMLHLWQISDQSIEVVTDGKGEKRYGYEAESLAPLESEGLSATPINALGDNSVVAPEDPPNENYGADNAADSGVIHQLILSVEARQTVFLLSKVANRLTQNSTIVFMQNGLGIVEEVNEKIFPNETTRPSYLAGLVTHDVYASSVNPFSVVHKRMGTIALGTPLPTSTLQIQTGNWSLTNMIHSTRYIMRTLTRTLDLAAVSFYPIDFFQLQVEKLAVHAVIYPLTVLFDCQNGGLYLNPPASRVIKLLLAEISLVIRSLPELQGVPNVHIRFSPKRLELLIRDITDSTTEQISPMLQDIRAARATDIKYISGYIIRRSEGMGITSVMNYMLVQMIRGMVVVKSRQEDQSLPVQ